MELRYLCTQCGKCCHDLWLPLSVAESIQWLRDGNPVQVICEAVPWTGEPSPDDQTAIYWRNRSFAAHSGTLPTRVIVILAANFAGACPNLQASMRCGIYERRPLVCRIYPAEISPFTQLVPSKKACPPEAWGGDRPVLIRDGAVVDAVVRDHQERWRETDAADARTKAHLCAALRVNAAALTKEGHVIYSPDPALLLRALERAAEERDLEPPQIDWQFVSGRAATLADIAIVGAVGVPHPQPQPVPYRYVGAQRP
jgi:Fe-S-cluster containining protein